MNERAKARSRRSSKAYKERHIAAGLCNRCPRPATAGRPTCEVCRGRARDRHNAHKERIKSALYAKQSGKCAGCQHALPMHILSIDHIMPQSRGGSHKQSNLQLLCHPCNTIKHTRTMEECNAAGLFDRYRASANLSARSGRP